MKHGFTHFRSSAAMSHPVRVRGLKLVTSKIDALDKSRTPYGCVD